MAPIPPALEPDDPSSSPGKQEGTDPFQDS